MFSPGGNGFMRLNVGTSRTILEKAMQQLLLAVHLAFKTNE
jgi:cystathionine beta-lyase